VPLHRLPPIIDAAQRMTELPKVAFDRAALTQQLQALQREAGTTYTAQGQSFHAPRTLEELVALRAAHPATLLAGSTDIGLWVTKQMRELGDIIYLGHVTALQSVQQKDGMLEIGAGVSLNDAYAALCKLYPRSWASCGSALPRCRSGMRAPGRQCRQRFADRRFDAVDDRAGQRSGAARPVRPARAAAGSLLSRLSEEGYAGRRIRRRARAAAAPDVQFRTYKLAKRFDQDISAVCAAFAFTLDGARWWMRASPSAAWRPRRAARAAEASLLGLGWNEANLRVAMDLLQQDYAPLSDMRASATACRRRRTCCAASGWRRAPMRRLRPMPSTLSLAAPERSHHESTSCSIRDCGIGMESRGRRASA
jgi:xanthine dehydrogenase small subunit